MGSLSHFPLPIPEEYQGELEYIEPTDTRSDEEILTSLEQHTPVTSEKNVWAFWDKGVAAMPGWCKRNVTNWVRILGPSWTVRVLDVVPGSPNHTLRYLPPDTLPKTFVDGTMDGPYVGPHSADFIRGAALYVHGGVFMDVGIMLIRHLDRICWDALVDESSPFQVCIPLMYGQITANHFVASRRGDPFIKRCGLIQHPLLRFIIDGASFDESREAAFTWNFKVDATTVFEYIAQVVCWKRLTHLDDAGDGFSCADYWENNVLVTNVIQEGWAAESLVGFDGQRLFGLLCLPFPSASEPNIDPGPSSSSSSSSEQAQQKGDEKEAAGLLWRLLARSSMQKVTHAKALTDDVMLGTLWDRPENEDADCRPGTFAWLLRRGPLCLRQTRTSIQTVPAPPVKERWRKGILEP
ncbi:hypothetical protein VTI28DRAFT_9055 [Corynascus sepedonium]